MWVGTVVHGSDFSVPILEICGFRNVNFVVWDWDLV